MEANGITGIKTQEVDLNLSNVRAPRTMTFEQFLEAAKNDALPAIIRGNAGLIIKDWPVGASITNYNKGSYFADSVTRGTGSTTREVTIECWRKAPLSGSGSEDKVTLRVSRKDGGEDLYSFKLRAGSELVFYAPAKAAEESAAVAGVPGKMPPRRAMSFSDFVEAAKADALPRIIRGSGLVITDWPKGAYIDGYNKGSYFADRPWFPNEVRIECWKKALLEGPRSQDALVLHVPRAEGGEEKINFTLKAKNEIVIY